MRSNGPTLDALGDIVSLGTADTDPDSTGYDTRVRLGTTIKTGDQVTGRVVIETGSDQSDTYTWGNGSSAGLMSGGDKQGELDILEAWIQYVPSNWGIKAGHMPLALGNKLFFDHTKFGDDAIVAFITPSDATHIAVLTIKFEEGSTISAGDDIDGYVGLVTHKVSDALNLGANWTYLNNSASELAFSNIGLTADGKVNNISWKADIEYQFGDRNATDDAGGYAGMVDVSAALDGFTVGAMIAYGSGDDDSTDNDADEFLDFLGALRYQSTMNGYILPSPATGTKNMGISNQQIYQLYASTNTTCPISGKDLSLKGRLNYMLVNEELFPGQEDDIGFEVELFADWKLAQGLIYGVEAAYLFTGDAWGGSGFDEDVYFLRHRLELSW